MARVLCFEHLVSRSFRVLAIDQTGCRMTSIVGASVSEPPSSDVNGSVSYIYILCVVRRATYPKLIQFNARNVYKIRIVQCSTMESYSNSSARVPKSSGNREDRLQRRRERERARRASETAEQREERLRVGRARDRARRAAQTAEERDARLRQIRDN